MAWLSALLSHCVVLLRCGCFGPINAGSPGYDKILSIFMQKASYGSAIGQQKKLVAPRLAQENFADAIVAFHQVLAAAGMKPEAGHQLRRVISSEGEQDSTTCPDAAN